MSGFCRMILGRGQDRMDHVKRILKDYYDLNITDVLPQQGGWASLAYKVSNKQQSYFLKSI